MSKFNRNGLDSFDLLEVAYAAMTKSRLSTYMDRPRKRDPKVYAESTRSVRAENRSLWSYMLVFKTIKGQLFAEFYSENANYTDDNHRTGYLQGVSLRKAIVKQCKKLGLPMGLANDLCAALDRVKG